MGICISHDDDEHALAEKKMLKFEKEGSEDIHKQISKHNGHKLSKDEADWIVCEEHKKMTYKFRAKPRHFKHDEKVECTKCDKELTPKKAYWACQCIPRKHVSKLFYCRDCGIKTVTQKSTVLETEEKCELGHNLEFKHHGAPAHDKDNNFICDECGTEVTYNVAFWKCVDTGHKDSTRELCTDCGTNNHDDK